MGDIERPTTPKAAVMRPHCKICVNSFEGRADDEDIPLRRPQKRLCRLRRRQQWPRYQTADFHGASLWSLWMIKESS